MHWEGSYAKGYFGHCFRQSGSSIVQLLDFPLDLIPIKPIELLIGE